MSTPNTPGPGRISPPILWLLDDSGYVIGYRNPKTGENVYAWFAGGSGGGGGSGVTWDSGVSWNGGVNWS